jgi:hypothetical protein
MGASISCSIFENFSTALHWFTELQCHNKNILHYLDDFLLGGPAESPLCQITLGCIDKSSTESPSGGYNLTREIQQTD